MSRKAIVIGTYGGREDWLRDCLESLNGYTHHPVISITVPWELNVIKWAYHAGLDDILFLQDTVIVKDYEWIDEAFAHTGSVSLCTKPFYMYLGKYTKNDLGRCSMYSGWPVVQSKRDAVTHEGEWTSWYDKFATDTRYLWDMPDEQAWAERNGRMNMVYENDHIIKYKGTWSPEMIL